MYKLLLLIILISSHSAFAGSWYFFEPAVGFYQGHYQTNKASGLGFDFKLGVNWDKMYFGADITYATELNLSAVAYDLDVNNTGLVVGYNGGGYRVWYTYLAGASNAYKSGGVEYEATGGGNKIGIGGKIGGNTYLNIETSFIKYDEISTDGTPADTDQFMDLTFVSVSWII
jgi:hypothetical protein